MDGKLPVEDGEKVIKAIGNVPDVVPEAFAQHLLKVCRDEDTSFQILQAAMNHLLKKLPHLRQESVSACCQAIRQGQVAACHPLLYMIRPDQIEARKEGRPSPPWFKEAAETALEVLKGPERRDWHAGTALQVYVWAVGAEADGLVMQFLVDDKAHDYTRRSVAQILHEASPRTGVYKAILPEYDKLPDQTRGALADSASQSPDAPGAEALVLRVFKDDAAMNWAHHMFYNMKLPLTPELEEGLEELGKNQKRGGSARYALGKLRREQGKTRGLPEDPPP
jgi:hypothetical protein